MRIIDDSSCSYHCCDQNGHSVCHKVAEWISELVGIIQKAAPLLPPDQQQEIRRVLAEDPDTSTNV